MTADMFFDQNEYDLRCEWGAEGIRQLAPESDVIIIVDVLSFSTCVDVAVGRGAIVFPYRWRDESAAIYAQSLGAELARSRREAKGGYSLSPVSLQNIPVGTRLVLPSPNGSALSMLTGKVPTLLGCLRNAEAVADAAQTIGKRVSVTTAGEKWEDGGLRHSIEDLIGAGAIINHLNGSRSPEAEVAVAAFRHCQSDLKSVLERCGSGKELIGIGFGADIELVAPLNVSEAAPFLKDGAYVRYPA